MNKITKFLLCFSLLALMIFVPIRVGVEDGPGPDDRPIGWISINSVDDEFTTMNGPGPDDRPIGWISINSFEDGTIMNGPGPDDRPIGWVSINCLNGLSRAPGYQRVFGNQYSPLDGPGPDDRPIGWSYDDVTIDDGPGPDDRPIGWSYDDEYTIMSGEGPGPDDRPIGW